MLKISLDIIAQKLSRHAHICMQEIGKVPATVFLWTDHGVVTYVPKSVTSPSEKDDFADIIRNLATAHNAAGLGLVAETWMSHVVGNPDSSLYRPSLAPNRVEGLLLYGEINSERQIRTDFTLRDREGGFQGFREYDLMGDEFTGRFLDLMPQGQTTKAKRRTAARRLRAMGVLRHK